MSHFYYQSCYYTSTSIFLPKLHECTVYSVTDQCALVSSICYCSVVLFSKHAFSWLCVVPRTVLLYCDCVPLHCPAGTTFLSSVYKLYGWMTIKPTWLNNTCHQLVITLHIVRKDSRQWKTKSFLLFKKIFWKGLFVRRTRYSSLASTPTWSVWYFEWCFWSSSHI